MRSLDPCAFEWDPTLYRGSARHYRHGRLPYAPGLADAVVRTLGLEGRGRLLDVGCGPGIVALDLASMFEVIVGVDADSDMIAEAEAEARRRGIENASWVHRRAEELPAGLGRFRVATFGQSFHWMNRTRVARTVCSMLEQAGALVHVNAPTRTGVEATSPLAYPQPPWSAVTELVRRYLGSEMRVGQGRREPPLSGHDDILRRWFAGPQVVTVPDGRILTRTADQVVAAVYSISSSAPHLFEERLRDFETKLRRLLAEASPDGVFCQQTGDTQLRIWRPWRDTGPRR